MHAFSHPQAITLQLHQGKSILPIESFGNKVVGKFRPRLIELTSIKPKLLIRFIINKTCYKTNKHQYYVKIMQLTSK